MTTTAHMVGQRLSKHSTAADEAVEEMRNRGLAMAEADHAYKLAWAKAYAQTDGTVDSRKADADMATDVLRLEAKRATVLYESAKEASRTKRTALTAVQTWAATVRDEMNLTRTGHQSAA